MKGLVILAINENDDPETVKTYFDKEGYTFTPLLQKKREVHLLFKVGANPTNYIVGPDGKIVMGSEGYPEDQIREALEKLLE